MINYALPLQLPEAMQKMHDRLNVGKIVIDMEMEPKPKPPTPSKAKKTNDKEDKKKTDDNGKEKEKKLEFEECKSGNLIIAYLLIFKLLDINY